MIRTGYSFHAAIGSIDNVIKRTIEAGYPKAVICDRNSTFGFNRFTKAAKKAGLSPVYGVELACVTELGQKYPIIDYWSFLAIDELRPLHDLIYLATGNPGREPQLTYAQALAAPGLIKITGNRTLINHIEDKDKVFISLRPSTPRGLYREASNRGFRFFAASDNYYPRLEDRELYRVALGQRADTQSYPQHILSEPEWWESIKWFANSRDRGEARHCAEEMLQRCTARLQTAELLKPQVVKSLRQLCEEGAQRTGTDLTNPVYRERLEKELKLIADKNFADYFYIIADLIRFAKTCMIVGPARGSSCGSLVCYLLDITTIDPIPFDLIFERFIDVNRTDLPDIDIDFSDARRDKVFEYAEEKYGKTHVARLGTVGLFRPRSALNQAGKALGIPPWEVKAVADTIIERSSGDARAMLTLEDTLADTEVGRKFINQYPEATIIASMEGQPTHASQHAAGLLLTNDPIINYVAVNSRTKAAMCDKKDSEDLNLLKIDALGLTQLSIFERCLELAGKPANTEYLTALPLNDQNAFGVLNKRYYSGIFQFNGDTLQSFAREITIDNIEDIIALTALARPGPTASGGATTWIKRRRGEEAITTAHPMLTELTKQTYGVVIYQETVMRIVREMGGMSWEDTSAIRKAMSGRLGDEFFEGFWQKFRVGATANGVPEDTAREIWRQINTMGSWAFNRSHAVAYGIVSYWCCYLKAYHPLEFAAATLDAEVLPGRQIAMLRELEKEGVGYIPYDINVSTDRWQVDGKRLVGPLTAIKKIGPVTMQEIIDARRNNEPIRDGIKKIIANAETDIKSLYPIRDAIASSSLINNPPVILTPPTRCEDIREGMRDVVITGVAARIAPLDLNEAIRVERRGGRRIYGPTAEINLFIHDDTGQVVCRIGRFKPDMIRQVIDTGRPGKSLYALKGNVLPNMKMLMVDRLKYLGDMDQRYMQQQEENAA